MSDPIRIDETLINEVRELVECYGLEALKEVVWHASRERQRQVAEHADRLFLSLDRQRL